MGFGGNRVLHCPGIRRPTDPKFTQAQPHIHRLTSKRSQIRSDPESTPSRPHLGPERGRFPSSLGPVSLSPTLNNNGPWLPSPLGPHELVVVQRAQALSATGRTEFFGRRAIAATAFEAVENEPQANDKHVNCSRRLRSVSFVSYLLRARGLLRLCVP